MFLQGLVDSMVETEDYVLVEYPSSKGLESDCVLGLEGVNA
jgi:hypothetical protein